MARPQAPPAPTRPASGNPLVRLRGRVRRTPAGRVAWRVAVSVVGVAIIVVGVVLLPLPGPGWLIIFAGLGVLATEFAWASTLLARARRTVERWTAWIRGRPRWVQLTVGLAGLVFLAAVALGCYWLYTVL